MIILVFGLPGTGKSYFARHLAREQDLPYLNTDVVRAQFGKKGEYDKESKEFIYQKLLELLSAEIQQGNDVLVDGTFHKKSRREQIEKLAGERSVPIFFVELKASEEVVKERLSGERTYSESDFDVYQQLKENFEPFTGPRLELWSDREELMSMLKKAKEYIYGKESN